MNKILGNKKAYAVFVVPALIVYIAMVIIPILMSARYSLMDWNGVGVGEFAGLDNYIKMFQDEVFWTAVKNSLILAIASIGFQLVPALIIAIVLARGIPFEKFFRTAFFIPVVISTVVIGQMFLKIYNPEYGALNALLQAAGIAQSQDWLGNSDTVLMAAFVPVMWQYTGYHMLLMYTATKSVSHDIYEAANIDGASGLQTAFHITIPLIAPMIKTSMIFAVTGSLKFFDFIWILTRGGPLHASEVPSTHMYQAIFTRNQYGYGSTIAIFIVAECLLFYFVIQKLFKRAEENVT